MPERLFYLSLGSNIDPETHLIAAVRCLGELGRIDGVSAVYRSRAVGGLPSDPDFLNVAVALLTALSVEELRETEIKRIERTLGRRRTEDPNAPRTIDIDLSLCGDEVIDPDILEFAHVAVPLADLAPDLVHPGVGRTLFEIAARFVGAPEAPLRHPLELRP